MSEVAKVIPLHGGTSGRSARAAAGSRERHPSAYADPREPTPLSAPAPADASAVTPSLPTPLLSMIDDTKSTIVDQISSVAEFVRRRLAGDYSVDEFGYDPHFADAVWLPLLRPLFDKWFRVEVKGIENIPSEENPRTGRITAFLEKEYRAEGLINAGVYLLNRTRFLSHSFPEKFSMEKEYLEENVHQLPLYGFTTEGYFIDIGIPEDFARAQIDFKNK